MLASLFDPINFQTRTFIMSQLRQLQKLKPAFCSGKQCQQKPRRVISQLQSKSTGKNLGETSALIFRKRGFTSVKLEIESAF